MRQENAGRTDKQQKEKRWLVTLSVELWAVGKLAIHIDHGDSRTAIRLFSENPEVLDWVAKKSPVLQAKLSKAGIENSEVEGHFGALPDSLQPQVDLPGLSATA
nr:flagellar hook-length control protein FliK [Litorivivens lipolytica]